MLRHPLTPSLLTVKSLVSSITVLALSDSSRVQGESKGRRKGREALRRSGYMWKKRKVGRKKDLAGRLEKRRRKRVRGRERKDAG